MQSAAPSVSAGNQSAAAKTAPAADARVACRRVTILTLAILGLLLSRFPAAAEEKFLTLAMVNYSLLPAHQLQSVQNIFGVSTPGSFATGLHVTPAAESRLLFFEKISFSTGMIAEMQAEVQRPFQIEPPNVLAFAGQNLRDNGFGRVWSRLGAGYGQIFYDQTASVYGRHGTKWEGPGFGYLKYSFRF